MPCTDFGWDYNSPYQKKLRKERNDKKRKHDEIVRAWKAGELTWNEYIRQEKKYRT